MGQDNNNDSGMIAHNLPPSQDNSTGMMTQNMFLHQDNGMIALNTPPTLDNSGMIAHSMIPSQDTNNNSCGMIAQNMPTSQDNMINGMITHNMISNQESSHYSIMSTAPNQMTYPVPTAIPNQPSKILFQCKQLYTVGIWIKDWSAIQIVQSSLLA